MHYASHLLGSLIYNLLGISPHLPIRSTKQDILGISKDYTISLNFKNTLFIINEILSVMTRSIFLYLTRVFEFK